MEREDTGSGYDSATAGDGAPGGSGIPDQRRAVWNMGR